MSSQRAGTLAAFKLHPAVIILAALAIASAGRRVWPLDAGRGAVELLRSIGAGVIVAGLVTLVFAYGGMARARTTIDPRRPTRRIVSNGIYRVSRNPIYLGWFLLILGAGLRNTSLFEILISLVMIVLLRWAVVPHEEKYLESAFGDEYLRYKQRVRRWL